MKETTGKEQGACRLEPNGRALTDSNVDVIDAASHWLGNLFQRFRAMEQTLEWSEHSLAEPLRKTVDELERLTRSLLDYLVQPPSELEIFHARALLGNVVLTLERRYRVQMIGEEVGKYELELLVNPSAMGTAVSYLPALLAEDGVPPGEVVTLCPVAEAGRFLLRLAAERSNPKRSAAGELYQAVMEKCLAGQGGGLRSNLTCRGGREWILWLSRAGPSRAQK